MVVVRRTYGNSLDVGGNKSASERIGRVAEVRGGGITHGYLYYCREYHFVDRILCSDSHLCGRVAEVRGRGKGNRGKAEDRG